MFVYVCVCVLTVCVCVRSRVDVCTPPADSCQFLILKPADTCPGRDELYVSKRSTGDNVCPDIQSVVLL